MVSLSCRRAAHSSRPTSIQDGAADDTAQPPAGPLAVASVSPAHQSTIDMAPNQVVVGFTREVDQSTVDANTFEVIGAGGDGVFGNANDNPLTANAINVNATSATFDLTNVVMNDDVYRVYLRGAGASVILDLDANALDGEFDGGFPSGDGTEGGDFVSQFEIVTPVVLEPAVDPGTGLHADLCYGRLSLRRNARGESRPDRWQQLRESRRRSERRQRPRQGRARAAERQLPGAEARNSRGRLNAAGQ